MRKSLQGGSVLARTAAARLRLAPAQLVSLAVLFALLSGWESATAEDCSPWPGEFSPLATVHSSDPMAARWALSRSRELARLARELEGEDPVEANRIWRRVLCFDSESEDARAGVERTRPRVVRQVHGAELTELEQLDSSLADTAALIRTARFREAMESVRVLRARIDGLGSSPELRRRLAHLEILAATALVAFGDDRAAQERCSRALAADPELRLDERATPPKVRRAFEAARSSLKAGDG